MTRLTSFFIVLSVLAVSTQAAVDPAVSSYCEKSRGSSFWYYPTLSHCCRQKCDQYIEPGATKYSLKNPSSEWTIRHCDCEIAFYRCVVEEMDSDARVWTRNYGFKNEQCFQGVTRPSPGKKFGEECGLVDVLDAVHRQDKLDAAKARDEARQKSSGQNSRRKRRQN